MVQDISRSPTDPSAGTSFANQPSRHPDLERHPDREPDASASANAPVNVHPFPPLFGNTRLPRPSQLQQQSSVSPITPVTATDVSSTSIRFQPPLQKKSSSGSLEKSSSK
ncbi:hypothetical protein AX17_003939 [Amanita inopinata Kibby_2008]|nr:hypothetical protein AX17_003939 [Amanita inopinata Kibby_2008]